MSMTENVHSSGLTKLVQTVGAVLHPTMRVIVIRPDASLLNIIQEYLIWRMLAIIFTMHARISAIYPSSKRYICHPIVVCMLEY